MRMIERATSYTFLMALLADSPKPAILIGGNLTFESSLFKSVFSESSGMDFYFGPRIVPMRFKSFSFFYSLMSLTVT
jgi:hypothetical protein